MPTSNPGSGAIFFNEFYVTKQIMSQPNQGTAPVEEEIVIDYLNS
jgi:hypothetical protein